MNRLKAWSPFLLSILFYSALLAVPLIRLVAATHGQQTVVAESVLCSSSILWPLLITAVGKIVGTTALLPVLLNIAAALALLAMAQYILIRSNVDSWIWQTLTLMLLALTFPLVALTLDGTVHILYGFAFLLFIWIASTVLDTEKSISPLHAPGLILSALLLTGCRYEGVFALLITCLFLAWRSRAFSAATALAGLIPIVSFGVFSHSHGGMWIPSAVAMDTFSHHSLLGKIFTIPRLLFSSYIWESGLAILGFLVFCLGILGRRAGQSNVQRYLIFLFLGAAVLHVQFGLLLAFSPGYESYLIGTGILLSSIGLYSIKRFENKRNEPLLFSLKLISALALIHLLAWRGVWWQIVATHGAALINRQ